MPLLTKNKKAAEASVPEPEQPTVPSAATTGTPVRQRRRPALIALGIALIIVCGLGAFWLVDRLSTTSQVVVAAAGVPEGQVLTAEDLTVIDVNVPSGTAIVPGSDLETLVGQRAVGPLEEGALITPGDVSTASFPAEGSAVVGVKVSAGQIPTADVDPGDPIRIVGTPREGDDPPSGDAPVITGTVQAISQPTTDGILVVDVLVSDDQSATLAALSATGRISIVLVPEEE
ncbi:MAG: SAF domain-containing protein [Brevibacterium aurantiacum]